MGEEIVDFALAIWNRDHVLGKLKSVSKITFSYQNPR